ncbi:MAG: UDP-N-acetylglucosamine 2-epimerase, partial [Owenweeksia sp.]
TLKQIRKFDEVPDFRIIEPLGYFQMIQALTDCSLLITDSGGMQKEAYYAGKYCITLREETEWTELLDEGVNVLAGHSRDSILDSVDAFLKASPFAVKNIYGDGQAAHKILETLKNGILERSA